MFSRLSARLGFSIGGSSHKTFKFFKRRYDDATLSRFGKLESASNHIPETHAAPAPSGARAAPTAPTAPAAPAAPTITEHKKTETGLKRWENPKMNIPHYYVSADLSLEPLSSFYAGISGTKPELSQIFSPFFVSVLQLSLRNLGEFSTIADIDKFYKIDGYSIEYVSISSGKKEAKKSTFRFGGIEAPGKNLVPLRVYDFAGTGVVKGSQPIPEGSNFCVFLGDFSHFLTDKGLEVRRNVTMSFDHRIIDGAKGAELLQKISEVFNEPLKVIH